MLEDFSSNEEQLLEPALNLTVHCCGREFRVLNCYDQKSFIVEERGLNDVPVLKRVPALTLRACLLSNWLVISACEPFGGSLSTFVVLEANVFPVGTHLRQTIFRILPVGCHLRQDLGLVVFSCTVVASIAVSCNKVMMSAVLVPAIGSSSFYGSDIASSTTCASFPDLNSELYPALDLFPIAFNDN
ncbi:hypothetical protein Tco_0511666 [Tanacetum coccineum]